MSLNICCDSFLMELSPVPVPPVLCPVCGKKIFYERIAIQSAMSNDEYDTPPYFHEGYSILNPKYIE